jgi:hypothetical protein
MLSYTNADADVSLQIRRDVYPIFDEPNANNIDHTSKKKLKVHIKSTSRKMTPSTFKVDGKDHRPFSIGTNVSSYISTGW